MPGSLCYFRTELTPMACAFENNGMSDCQVSTCCCSEGFEAKRLGRMRTTATLFEQNGVSHVSSCQGPARLDKHKLPGRGGHSECRKFQLSCPLSASSESTIQRITMFHSHTFTGFSPIHILLGEALRCDFQPLPTWANHLLPQGQERSKGFDHI